MNDIRPLTRYLLDGDTEKASAFLENLANEGEPSEKIYQDEVTASMREVGELWLRDEISVADEHVATSTCDYMLAKFHSYKMRNVQKDSSKRAMFFSVENEQHTLGMKMASYLFEQNGWDVRMMGANLPIRYAMDIAERFQPSIVGLSLTIVHRLESLEEYLLEIQQLASSPTILVGSRLIQSFDLSKYTANKAILIDNFDEVMKWVRQEGVEVRNVY